MRALCCLPLAAVLVQLAAAQCPTTLGAGTPGAGLDHYGTSIAGTSNRVLVGAPRDSLGGSTYAGAAYVYDVAGGGPSPRLTAIPRAAGAAFGFATAIDGDRLAVGAPAAQSITPAGTPPAGAVFVFELVNGAWTQTARLQPATSTAGDLFGWCVALDGDWLLATAMHVWGNAQPSAVHAFEHTPSGWVERQRIAIGNERTGFGRALALRGDTALVGEGLASADGRVHVLTRLSTGRWVVAQMLPELGSGHRHARGYLALDGDTAFVGAPAARGPASSQNPGDATGVVQVYVRNAATRAFELEQTIAPRALDSSSVSGVEFGFAVALRGDRAVIGARSEFTTSTAGSVTWSFPTGGSFWTYERIADDLERWFPVCKATAEFPWASESSRLGTAVGIADGLAVGGAPVGQLATGQTQGVHVQLALPTERASFGSTPSTFALVTGGAADMALNAGPARAGHVYLVLGTASGTTPGVPLAPGVLPLNVDAYTNLLATLPNVVIANQLGMLDARGQATARLEFPPLPLTSSLYGTRFDHAFLTLDPATATFTFVSRPSRLFVQ